MAITSFFHYKKFKAEHLETLLRDESIKFTRPDMFNDPWDCRVKYRVPRNEKEISDLVEYFKYLNKKVYPHISDQARENSAQELIANPQGIVNAVQSMSSSITKAVSEQYRVFCLAEEPDCILMWAHYADCHKGICLEFDASQLPFQQGEIANKVEYVSEYPEYNILSSDILPLIVKSKIWSYEKEWRLIAEDEKNSMSEKTYKTKNDFLRISRKTLKSVILGCRISEKGKETVHQIIKKYASHVVISEAKVLDDRYGLEIS